MSTKKLILVLIFFLPQILLGQQILRKNPYVKRDKIVLHNSISIIDVLEQALINRADSALLIQTKSLTVEIPQETFILEDSVIYFHLLKRNPSLKLNTRGQIIIPNYLYLVVDSLNVTPLIFEGLEFSKGAKFYFENGLVITISSCYFKKYTEINAGKDFRLEITENTFLEGLSVKTESNCDLILESNKIYPEYEKQNSIETSYRKLATAVKIGSENLNTLSFIENKVYDPMSAKSITFINVDVINDLNFSNNNIEGLTDLSSIKVERRVTFIGNTFKNQICLFDFNFPPNFNKIYWDQFSGEKLVILRKQLDTQYMGNKVFIYDAQGDSLSTENQKDLTVVYKALHSVFANNGDTESANGCYAEKKDVEGAWLGHIYMENGGFKNYLNYKLNRLLKIYTNHGTDPAIAIIISLYVILFFAVFYFFFPSEWDIASKSRLVQNFKDFKEKNDKGYIKPLLYLIGGFMLSFLNALTLSINSFVTLGFGNIPTKGAARYVCILQGFIGWFLLSIFTVALINQVLS